MNDLDRLIDGALSSYASEPAPGLEQRVLRHARQPSRWWMPIVAAAAAAVVVFVAIPEQADVPPPQLIVHSPAVPVLPKPPATRPPAVRVVAAKPATGVPLSPQERQLEKFALAYPELARQAFVEAPKQMNEPVVVSELAATEAIGADPIVIQPLETVAPDNY